LLGFAGVCCQAAPWNALARPTGPALKPLPLPSLRATCGEHAPQPLRAAPAFATTWPRSANWLPAAPRKLLQLSSLFNSFSNRNAKSAPPGTPRRYGVALAYSYGGGESQPPTALAAELQGDGSVGVAAWGGAPAGCPQGRLPAAAASCCAIYIAFCSPCLISGTACRCGLLAGLAVPTGTGGTSAQTQQTSR